MHAVADPLVPLDDAGAVEDGAVDERGGGGEQRVALEVGGDLRAGAIGRLDVRAGMPHQPDGAEVEHGRPARLADGVDDCLRVAQRAHRLGPVDRHVLELREPTQRPQDPSGRSRSADPDAVVLADEENGRRDAAVRHVGRGVERALGGRVVDRRVAERAHDDRVFGPWQPLAGVGRKAERVGEADRSREMRRDRRRLRDDAQLGVAEHLVAAARHRLVGGRHESEEDVADRVDVGRVPSTARRLEIPGGPRRRRKPPDR